LLRATLDGPGEEAFFSAATGESRSALPSAAIGDAPPETLAVARSVPEFRDRPALTLRLRGVDCDFAGDFDRDVPERS
jgi:hypothetical protein